MECKSLPVDLIEDILSRVPAKSLARFRSTSKQWNALFKSVSFAVKHSANAPKEESLAILLMDSRVYLVRINLNGVHNYVAPSVKLEAELNLEDPLCNSSQVGIRNVFHCDGLLLCTTEDNRLVVWNPCLGETKWIKPRDCYKTSDCYALGYDNTWSGKQYKILRLDLVRPFKKDYEIYDFTSNSWRVVSVATDWFLPEYSRGVSVNGNTFWLAVGFTQEHGRLPRFLLSFDFSTERFQSLSLPHHHFPDGIPALSVVREEKLCLLVIKSTDLQVWVGTSTGSVMPWSKSLSMEAYKHERNTYEFSDWMSFLADEQNKVVVSCNPDNILQIVVENRHILVDPLGRNSTRRSSYPFLLNYVPSLTQIHQQGTLLGGRKRKASSMSH